MTTPLTRVFRTLAAAAAVTLALATCPDPLLAQHAVVDASVVGGLILPRVQSGGGRDGVTNVPDFSLGARLGVAYATRGPRSDRVELGAAFGMGSWIDADREDVTVLRLLATLETWFAYERLEWAPYLAVGLIADGALSVQPTAALGAEIVILGTCAAELFAAAGVSLVVGEQTFVGRPVALWPEAQMGVRLWLG